MKRSDLIISASLIVVIGGLVIWAVVDTQRRSRDTQKVSEARQVQAALESYRIKTGSYPASLDGVKGLAGIRTVFAYAPEPQSCGPSLESLCTSYTLGFAIEGRVGTLSGKHCEVTPERITCTP